jgi:hypothetical protein
MGGTMEQHRVDLNRGKSATDTQQAGHSRTPEGSRLRGFFDVAEIPALWQLLGAAGAEQIDATGNGVQSD